MLELDAYAPSTRLGATALLKIGQALRDSGDRGHAMRALDRQDREAAERLSAADDENEPPILLKK